VRALDGGSDGLAAYRGIFAEAPRHLGPGGALVIEIGLGQEEAIRAMAPLAGFEVRHVAPDLAGHPRAVVLQLVRQGALANGNSALI
jgi:release factor glutamine methyltransferase